MPPEGPVVVPVSPPVAPPSPPVAVSPPAAPPSPPVVANGTAPVSPPAAPAASPWPDDWRSRLANGDADVAKRLERFSEPAAITKSWLEAEGKIRTGAYKRGLPDNASAEEIAAYRKDNGIPEKPDGYLKALPDGLVVSDDDKAMMGAFLADMHEAHAPPALVKQAVGWYYKQFDKMLEGQQAADSTQAVEARDSLRDNWGPEFSANTHAIDNWLDGAPQGIKSALLDARLPDGRLMRNSPDVMRFFAAQARELGVAGVLAPSGGGDAMATVNDELASMQKMMGDRNSDYWKGPRSGEIQKRFRDLTEMQQRAKARG